MRQFKPNAKLKSSKISELTSEVVESFGSNLEHLELDCVKMTAELSKVISGQKKLKTLKFYPSPNQSKHLIDIAKNCIELESVTFYGVTCPNEYRNIVPAYDTFFEKRSSSLKNLEIRSIRNPGKKFYQEQDRFLKNLSLCQNLEFLQIGTHRSVVTNYGLDIITKLINLRKLCLINLGPTVTEINSFLKKSNSKNLTQIFMSGSNCVTEEFFITLTSKKSSKLKYVHIYDCPNLKFQLSTLKSLVGEKFSCLTQLGVEWSNIAEIPMNMLQHGIKKNSLYVLVGKAWVEISKYINIKGQKMQDQLAV